MAELQNVTNGENLTDYNQDWRYLSLIDYRALSGIITDDDGIRKMPVEELATAVGVARKTLYEWQKRPGFWAAVNTRRKEMTPNFRLSKVHEVWYLSSLKPGNEGFRDRQLFLANFDDDFRMPTEKVEHEMGNSWAALIESKRKVVDVDGSSTDNPS